MIFHALFQGTSLADYLAARFPFLPIGSPGIPATPLSKLYIQKKLIATVLKKTSILYPVIFRKLSTKLSV